jgi:hypothetical protein
VFAFHPIHLFLNYTKIDAYHALKERIPKIAQASPGLLSGYARAGAGPQSLFMELIEHLAARQKSLSILDLHDLWWRQNRCHEGRRMGRV